MMIPERKDRSFAFLVLIVSILILAVQGCFPAGMPRNGKEDDFALQPKMKVPAKAGIYLNDSIRGYKFLCKKSGVSFEINIGEQLVPVARQMASLMFEHAVFVDSLPPYMDGYRPDVDAVIEPELVYYRGAADGAIWGVVDTRVKMRATIYDLSGKALWRGESAGESRSRRFNFFSMIPDGARKIEQAGYEALRSSAAGIVNGFDPEKAEGLHTLLGRESPSVRDTGGAGADPGLSDRYFREGVALFEKKNYHQALSAFERAEQMKQKGLSAAFYAGACNAYMGKKSAALKKFEKVAGLHPGSREAADARKWIKVLEEPLKIGIVVQKKNTGQGGYRRVPESEAISRAMGESRMYELADMGSPVLPAGPSAGRELEQFLDKVYKKGIRAVVFITVEDMSGRTADAGDAAEYRHGDVKLTLTAKVFSTRKRRLHAEMVVDERMSILGQKNGYEEPALRERLLERGARKLVFRMLENGIF